MEDEPDRGDASRRADPGPVPEPPGAFHDARCRRRLRCHASRTLTGIPIPARLNGAAVLPGLFDGLGARPLRGRTLRPEDGEAGSGPVVILSDRTWRTHFGGREDISKRESLSATTPTRVVGIMPESIHVPVARRCVDESKLRRRNRGCSRILDYRRTIRTSTKGREGSAILRAHALVKPGVRYEQALAEVRSLIGPLPNGKVTAG